MKINFLKKFTTGRILIILYLLVCIMAAYNIYPILELTNQSIKRYNEIFSKSTRKFELMTELRKNFNTIQSAQFKHVLAYSQDMMEEEEKNLAKALQENNAIFSEYQTLVDNSEEQRYLDTVLALRKINAETRVKLIRLSALSKRHEAFDFYITEQEKARLNYSNAVEDLTEYIVKNTNENIKAAARYIVEERQDVNILLGFSAALILITGVVVFLTNNKLNTQNTKLVEQERKFHTIIDTTDEMIFNVDKSGQILWANRAMKENLHYEDEDIKSLRLENIIKADSNHELQQKAFLLNGNNNNSDSEYTFTCKLGREVFVEGKSIALKEKDTVIGAQVFVRNITARKKAEENLKRTTTQLEHVLNIFDHSFWGADIANHRMLYVSPGNEKVFGYPEKDFMANGNLWFEIVVDEDKPRFNNAWYLLMQGKSALVEFRINHPVEGIKWVESKMAPTLDETGKLVRIDGLAIDISDRKKFEEELAENNRVLKTINSELDRFVYSTSHDLRAPLLSLEGLLNLSQEHIDSKHEVQHYQETMRKVISQMDETIKEILDYSRNARMEIKPEQLNIRQMVLNIKDNVGHITGRSNIRFSALVDDAIPFYSDKGRVNALINNLISNAYKYIRKDEPNPYVKFSFTSTAEEGIIRVEDNGEGIAEEYKEKIFEMFFRASEQYEGSGLGLYICREILNRLHGSIEVQSTPCKGSTFTVRIPNENNEQEQKML